MHAVKINGFVLYRGGNDLHAALQFHGSEAIWKNEMISFFQRLDSLHMAIWVLVSFIRASLFLLVGSSCLNKLLPLRLHKFSPWITTGATLVLSLIIFPNVRILYATINFWVTVVPVMLLGTVLPVVLVIIGAVRKHKEASQCAS